MGKDMESDVLTDGQPGEPNQGDSSGTAQTSAIDYTALAEALRPFISEEVGKRQQSLKDKRVLKLDEKVSGFEAQLAKLAELEQRGIPREDAIWRMRVDEALAGQGNVGDASPDDGDGTPSKVVSADMEPVLGIMGINPNAAEVAQILRETSDPIQQVAKFAQLAEQQKTKAASAAKPKPASVAQMGVGSVQSQDSEESLAQELARLMENPDKNAKQISDVKKRLIQIVSK